ncbi:potassium channel family protein [Luteolibacter marinus]|uniref:potassium channel family protein n=1 Tax=Luteolibacter marinus TaxID=2776705 RepID=UPI001867DB93|nr:TrkA family potassium uptake protein [Luteolibacter marinus]
MKYGIIGLGTFGRNLVIELSAMGHEVIAIDTNEASVERVKDHATLAVVADATHAALIEELGLASLDFLVVAIGKKFEASVMVTTRMHQVGGPKLYVRVVNELHEQLLEMTGVDGVIKVEALAASQFARKLDNQGLIRHFGVDDSHAVAEVAVPDSFVGLTLRDVELRAKHRLNLITIRRTGKGEEASCEVIKEIPSPDLVFEEGDLLVVYGHEQVLKRFSEDVN